MSYIIRMAIIWGVSSLIACQKYSNAINPSILACGEDTDPSTRLIPVVSSSGTIPAGLLDASFLEENTTDKPVSVTSKACVRIQRDETRSLLVRTNAGQNFAAIYKPNSQQGPIELQDVSDQNPFLECPQNVFANQNIFSLRSFVKGRYTPEAIRLETQLNGEPAFAVVARDPVRGWLTSLDALPEGKHTITVRLTNMFRDRSPQKSETCAIFVDRQKPEPKISYAANFLLEPEDKVFTRNPGEMIDFEISNDGAPHQLFYCMKSLEDPKQKYSCDQSEYLSSLGSITAPDHGLWALSYYAQDAAGNRSEIKADRFLVYDSTEIENINGLVKLARSDFLQDQSFKAMAQLLQAEQKRQKLSQWEQKDVYYPLLQGILEQMPRLRQTSTFKAPTPSARVRTFAYTLDGNGWVLGGDMPTLQVLDREGHLIRELGQFENPVVAIRLSASGHLISTKDSQKAIALVSLDNQTFCQLPSEPRFSQNPKTGRDEFNIRDDEARMLHLYNDRCEKIGQIPFPEDPGLVSISVSNDRKWIVTSSEETMTTMVHKLFAVEDLKQPVRIASGETIITDTRVDPVFHGNGQWVVFCNPNLITVMNLNDASKDFQTTTLSRLPPDYCQFLDDNFLYVGHSLNKQIIALGNGIVALTLRGDRAHHFNSVDQKIFEMYETDSQVELTQIPWFSEWSEKTFRLIFREGDRPTFAFHPSASREFASITSDGNFTVWEPESNMLTQHPSRQALTSPPMTANPDHGYIIWNKRDNQFDIMDRQHQLKRSLKYAEAIADSSYLRVDPQGRFIAVASRVGKLRIWSLDGKTYKSLSFSRALFYEDLEFSQDGRFLYYLDGVNQLMTVIKLEDFSFSQVAVKSAAKTIHPVNDSDFILHSIAGDGTTSVLLFNHLGILIKDWSYQSPWNAEPEYGTHHWAYIDAQGNVQVVDSKNYTTKNYGSIPHQEMDCKLRFARTDVVVSCSSGNISIHRAEGGVSSLKVPFAVAEVREDKDGNVWITASQLPKAELRTATGQLLITLTHPSLVPGEMIVTDNEIAFTNWTNYRKEIHVLPRSLTDAIKPICRWARNYLKNHQDEYPGLDLFCDKTDQQ